MAFDQKAYQRQYQIEYRKKNSNYSKDHWNSDKTRQWYKQYMQTDKYKLGEFAKRLKRRYKLTVEQYNAMLEVQNGVCALCENPPAENDRLCVDHDADSKAVRKLLCRQCNVGLGNLKHNPKLLRRAANYLEEFYSK